jgi:uncharacterized protein (TIGR00730 family)
MKRICIFCGSNSGARPAYAQAATALAQHLANLGIGIVYGGGNVGLMGILADAALAAGGEVIGVIPHSLFAKEVGHADLSQMHIVGTMHERKAMMADLADGFIAMPGGWGTFDEFCEILTWAQLGLHHKPCGILNVEGYYDTLLAMFDHSVAEGFLKAAYRPMILTSSDPVDLLDKMQHYRAPVLEKWIFKSDT